MRILFQYLHPVIISPTSGNFSSSLVSNNTKTFNFVCSISSIFKINTFYVPVINMAIWGIISYMYKFMGNLELYKNVKTCI